MSARTRYDNLASDRSQFLEEARQASELTLPYLIRGHEEYTMGMKQLKTPYQSVGAKGVVTLASKLMLALLPVQTSFFKLQLDESQLGQEFAPQMRSELDLSFAKIERIILESIAASDDRVAVHQALLHLVVAGNAMVFMSKNGLKVYPLNRYVVDRDGNGQVVDAQKRILELMNDKTESDSKVIEQKRFIQEIRGQLARVDEETVEKINKFMSDIPDVVDSKQVLKDQLPKDFSQTILEYLSQDHMMMMLMFTHM